MTSCVFCETTSNLNTQMAISVGDGQKVTVAICDAHAEEATVKSARDAYTARQAKIEAVLAQARALGFELSPKGKIIVASQPEAAKPTAPVTQQTPLVDAAIDANDQTVIDAAVFDSRSARQIVSVGGTVEGGVQVQSHSNLDPSMLSEKLPPELRQGKVKVAVVEGRDGQPLLIPEQRVDGTGVTSVAVVKGETDASLQRRFKSMAHRSIHNDQTPDFAKSGYNNSLRDCPLCRSSPQPGYIKTKSGLEVCPKCKGATVISLT